MLQIAVIILVNALISLLPRLSIAVAGIVGRLSAVVSAAVLLSFWTIDQIVSLASLIRVQ